MQQVTLILNLVMKSLQLSLPRLGKILARSFCSFIYYGVTQSMVELQQVCDSRQVLMGSNFSNPGWVDVCGTKGCEQVSIGTLWSDWLVLGNFLRHIACILAIRVQDGLRGHSRLDEC